MAYIRPLIPGLTNAHSLFSFMTSHTALLAQIVPEDKKKDTF